VSKFIFVVENRARSTLRVMEVVFPAITENRRLQVR